MSTERIFGGWDTSPNEGEGAMDELIYLWHMLAAQQIGKPDFQPNLGLSQRKAEIVMLWSLFQRARPRVIVEIGVAQGGTLAGWCQLATWPCTIIAIDRDLNDCRPRPGDPVHAAIYDGPLKLSSEGGGCCSLVKPHQKFFGLQGWSFQPEMVAAVEKVLNGQRIDWLFSDASHASEMFTQEFDAYWPMVSDGGVLCSHDINWSADPKCDKQKAWHEITRSAEYSARFEFHPHISVSEMSIGVLIR